MNLLLIFPGFILAFLVVLFYEYRIKKLLKSIKNKVHFYVTCELNHRGEIIRILWLGKPHYKKGVGFVSNIDGKMIALNNSFLVYNLNYSDFEDMKNGEIREVYLDLED